MPRRPTFARRRGLPRALAVLSLVALVPFAACTDPPAAVGPGEPLFDTRRGFEVLVEGRAVAPPSAMSGNRFLSGWWPVRRDGREILIGSADGARVELVHLAARPRKLVFDLDESVAAGGTVLVRAAGRTIARQPLTDPLAVDLPADLPLGRVLVELLPAPGAQLAVRAAAARSALPVGTARVDGDSLLQAGNSFVDVVRVSPALARLTGWFEPPGEPRADQTFEVSIETARGRTTGFAWDGRRRGRQPLDIPLGDEAGPVRIRLEASGGGPPGRWSGLAIHAPESPGPADGGAGTSIPRRPRLVVLYVMDALRADHVGHLGGPAGATPTLDRLAAQGVAFTRHRSVAPNTLPSTKALLTGIAPMTGGGAPLPAAGPTTLAEVFREGGYATALFSNNPYVGEAYGVDRGFDHAASPEAPAGSDPGFHDDARRIHDAALGWLRSIEPGRPAFLYLHTLHPHNPYDPPPPWRDELTAGIASSIDGSTETLLSVQRRRRPTNEADRRRLAALYAGGLAYNDAELGTFLREIEALYPAGDTLLAATSDHGEELFDHGGVLHGYTLYEEMLRIPLVLWAPGRLPPGRRSGPTSTLDLHATLLAAAASPTAGGGPAAGEGRPLVGSGPAGVPVHFAAAASVKGGIFSAQSRRWKLILAPRTRRAWGMGESLGRSRDGEYLFDLATDPAELVNRAGEGGLEADLLRARLRAWLDAKRRAETDPADPDGTGPPIDPETRARLRALGYIE